MARGMYKGPKRNKKSDEMVMGETLRRRRASYETVPNKTGWKLPGSQKK